MDKLTDLTRQLGIHKSLHGDPPIPKYGLFGRIQFRCSCSRQGNNSSVSKFIVVRTYPLFALLCMLLLPPTRRASLWSSLIDASAQYTGPWLVAGDFNTISSWQEKKGGARRDNDSMFDFNNFQVQAGLSDAGFTGAKFTWCNNRQEDAHIWMRLDRVLLNGPALAYLPSLKVQHLARVASDHCPLLIKLGESIRRPSSFKYMRAWHSHESFLNVVSDSWTTVCHNNPLLNIALKLKARRQRLKTWNWCTFGNTSLKQELITTQRNHYQILADKARAKWMAKGDRNSKLFHAMIKARRVRNNIKIELADRTAFSVNPPPEAFADIDATISESHNEQLTALPSEQSSHNVVKSFKCTWAGRPINFINKIISGILNARPAKVLPLVISPEQSGFMSDRNMTEAIALAHDLTCHINNGRPGVLWDGSPYGHFKSNQGVRQGVPISPSLFIITMEIFSRLLISKCRDGSIIPYFVKAGALQIPHLLYSDDMLVFTNACEHSMQRLQEVSGNNALHHFTD
ncbi:hypothetical protein QQ045_002934 [Rhodiola kirilowii]